MNLFGDSYYDAPTPILKNKVAAASLQKEPKFQKWTDIVVIPQVKVKPEKIIFFNSYVNLIRRRTHHENFKKKRVKGVLSSCSEKRIRTAINWLLYITPRKMQYFHSLCKTYPFQLAFLTLTLPSYQVSHIVLPCGAIIQGKKIPQCFAATNIGFGQVHYNFSDSEIKKIVLNQFLIEIRQIAPGINYIWKAETQSNGNLHFHLVINKYIKYDVMRLIWNRCCNKLGITNKYTDKYSGMSFDNYCTDRNYTKKSEKEKHYEYWKVQTALGWKQPNSIDVHSVRNVQNMAAYLMKYFVKNNEVHRYVVGNLWYLSEQLSKFNGYVTDCVGQIEEECKYLLDRTMSLLQPYDHASILRAPIDLVAGYISKGKLYKEFLEYVQNILWAGPGQLQT